MIRPKLLRVVLAQALRGLRALEVGNPLVSWTSVGEGQEGGQGGVVVLDAGICFQIPGSVYAVKAHFTENAEEQLESEDWPLFVLLEHVETEERTIWKVTATSDARRISPFGRPTQLQLASPLPARPGQCLGWHTTKTHGTKGVRAVGFTDAASFGQRWAHPDGKDQMALSALADMPHPPNEGSHLRFHKLYHRRYALVAEQEPYQNSFHRYALDYFASRNDVEPVSRSAVSTNCWSGTTPEMCCVPAGIGTPWCFDAVYTYELCCTPSAAGVSGWTPSSSSLPPSTLEQLHPNLVTDDGLEPSPRPSISVDLFVRTYHAKLEELTHLLHSVALFWPADWGVVVVLDGNSLQDEHACSMLPKWVRCILQPVPAFLSTLKPSFSHVDPFGHLGGVQRQRGLVWKEWSECWADKYSRAQFIAVCDSDVVLTTFGLPQLLFQPAEQLSNGVRPVVWAHADNAQFPNTVAALGLPIQAEFMDGFPLVIKRRHFRSLRHHIVGLYGSEPKHNSSRENFDGAFAQLLAKISVLSGGSECPSFHSMMGSVLWAYHRNEYVWSIRHGHLTGVALQHTCPRLRVAQHVAYWGKENWVSYAGLPEKHLKVGGHPAVLSEVAYAARSTALILSGLCATQWMEINASTFASFAKLRQNFTSLFAGRGLQVPDAGLLEVQRDLCSHGLRLAEGRAEIEERLLARSFPGQRWTSAEAKHCGNLQPATLLAAYRRLMRTIVFTIPQSSWKKGPSKRRESWNVLEFCISLPGFDCEVSCAVFSRQPLELGHVGTSG